MQLHTSNMSASAARMQSDQPKQRHSLTVSINSYGKPHPIPCRMPVTHILLRGTQPTTTRHLPGPCACHPDCPVGGADKLCALPGCIHWPARPNTTFEQKLRAMHLCGRPLPQRGHIHHGTTLPCALQIRQYSGAHTCTTLAASRRKPRGRCHQRLNRIVARSVRITNSTKSARVVT